ncbi:MAG: citrate synthase [Acidimicrobiales bacterium]
MPPVRPATLFTGISSTEAARRLGVKRETIYSYVSRGMLSSRKVEGKRDTRFDPVEVARLAARQRAGAGRAGRLEVVIDSGLTLLDPAGALWYRGWNAVDASRSAWFEHVAMWLWGRYPPSIEEDQRLFEAPANLLAQARKAVDLAGATSSPLDRYLLALAAAADADPYRHSRDPFGVANRGARMIAVLVESLPVACAEVAQTTSDELAPIAERLWWRLSSRAPSPDHVRILNAALILLADHELAASTLAARVAASTWADIYKVVMAGMATLGGPLHGSVGDRTVPLLREAASAGVGRAVGERLREGQDLPGFGHLVYLERDPRGDALLEQIRLAWPDDEIVQATDAVIDAVREERPAAFPNIDLAVAALIGAAGMIDGAAEAIFATARTAGWIAHGIEEYAHRLRFRPRAAYTGPEPGSLRTGTAGPPGTAGTAGGAGGAGGAIVG